MGNLTKTCDGCIRRNFLEYIDKCRACGSKEIATFFDLGQQPFANSLLKAKTKQEKKYPLSLSWCCECSLVQLNQTAEPGKLFSSYVCVTGTSHTAVNYSIEFCDTALAKVQSQKEKGYVLELASNDGTFLRPFINKGYDVLGVDPAQNIVEKAVSEGIPTRCSFFGTSVAEKIVAERGRPKILFARNVLPHVANLYDFVRGIELCADEETLVIIEVHYSKDILEELHYDSIYHEHLCYFSLKSIENLLGRYNLYVNDVMKSPISGGSLVLFIGKQKDKSGSFVLKYRNDEKKHKTNDFASWQKFAEKSYTHKTLLLKLLDEELRQGHKVVGYGASARSSTLLNFCGIDSGYISVIADQNPLKQGLFTAGTGIPIDSLDAVMDAKPDTIFVLAWNFKDEIIDECKRRGYTGSYLIPFPDKPYLLDSRGAVCDESVGADDCMSRV